LITSKGWILVALAAVVLLVLLNLSSIQEKAPAPLLGKEIEDNYDYLMLGINSKRHNNNGEVISTLKADKLIHFPGRQQIVLTSPMLDFTVSQQRWSLHAEVGTLSEITNELILAPLVSIKNQLSVDHLTPQQIIDKSILIEVERLNFNLTKQIAYSPNRVNFSSLQWNMKGKGLAINIPQKSLRILNNVEALHENP